MPDPVNLDSLLLSSIGITQGARDLAASIYQLQEKDSNVAGVLFSRHSLSGYSGLPFLVANVELKRPFEGVESLREYLRANNLPCENGHLIVEHENPLIAGFVIGAYTSDAFCAKFYQPSRFRDI